MAKLKITFIHPDLGIGGAERLVLDVASALTEQNHKVTFITNHFDKTHAFQELKNGDYPVQVIGDWLPRSIFVYVLFFKRNDQPDLFFVDSIPIAIPFLKLAGQTVIYYCHHPDLLASAPGGKLKQLYRKPINWLELKATGQADILLVNSEYTASVFRKTFPEITKPIRILYPTIAFSYQETVDKLRFSKPIQEIVPEIRSNVNNLMVFLSLNRFHPAKKLELALQGMDKLKSIMTKAEWEKVFLIMAGGFDPQSSINSECYNDLVTQTKIKNLQDKVIFLKSPSDDLKAELLNSCSCLVYTPVKEHFGIVPLEAMTVAKPVIACNSGGPRETVDHGVTGYLCEPTADSMAEFMYRIFNENTIEMGLEGKKRLQEKFSYKSFGDCIKKVVSDASKKSKKML